MLDKHWTGKESLTLPTSNETVRVVLSLNLWPMEHIATHKGEQSGVVRSFHTLTMSRSEPESKQAFTATRVYLGKTPYGYVRDIEGIIPDPETAPFVVQAFLLSQDSGISITQVLCILTKQGLMTSHGNPLSKSTLHHILRNPLYAGFVMNQGVLYPGQHQSLVSRKVFEQVQCNLSLRHR